MIKIENLVVAPSEVEFESLLFNWWSWLKIESYKPWYLTQFGDWVLLDTFGKVYYLDALEGTLQPIAESQEAAITMFSHSEIRDRFFLEGLVIGMNRRGLVRSPGQSFAYKIHPILGGSVGADNVRLLDVAVWQAICGQIHEQIRTMPPGSRIRGMEFVGGFQIKLIVE